jgi:hypothetical protein
MKILKKGNHVQLKNPVMAVESSDGEVVTCIIEGYPVKIPIFLLEHLETQDEIDCRSSMTEDIDQHLGQD